MSHFHERKFSYGKSHIIKSTHVQRGKKERGSVNNYRIKNIVSHRRIHTIPDSVLPPQPGLN